MVCYARQHSDQMVCGKCGLQWDVNDPEPPKCKTALDLSREILKDVKQLVDETNAMLAKEFPNKDAKTQSELETETKAIKDILDILK